MTIDGSLANLGVESDPANSQVPKGIMISEPGPHLWEQLVYSECIDTRLVALAKQ